MSAEGSGKLSTYQFPERPNELVAQMPGWATGGPALATVGAAVGWQVVQGGAGGV